jgi:large subunit ribosomal protein L21
MYAVVKTGGKQYRVEEGNTFRIEKIPGDVGSSVSFEEVLLFSDGDNLKIGKPMLGDVTVQGHIVEQDRAKKIIVFKYKRRKRYRKKQGHRQAYTAVRIDSIRLAGASGDLEQKPQVSDKEEVE